MRVVLLLVLMLPASALAEILSVDFVKVLNNNLDEALYYYENNWKRYRSEAARLGYISSYRLLVRTSDEGGIDIVLLTGYKDEAQYRDREENFAVVMNRGDGEGPRLLNETPPNEFREVYDAGNYSDR